jgi:SRSO17 transposase
VYMPGRWARDMPRRRAAGIPADLQFATKPQLAMQQLGRLTAAGLPVTWAAFDEVYGRSEELRKKAPGPGSPTWRSSRVTTRFPCRPAR